MCVVLSDVPYDPKMVQRAAASLIAAVRATPSLASVATFRNDIVDVVRQSMSDLMLPWHAAFKTAYDAKVSRFVVIVWLCLLLAVLHVLTACLRMQDLAGVQSWGAKMLALIDDFDTLLVHSLLLLNACAVGN